MRPALSTTNCRVATCPSPPSADAGPLFTETNTAPASPTRSEMLCFALSRTVSPCASMRPPSDCPSTVVRNHEERRASTSNVSAEDAEDDAGVSAAPVGAGVAVVGAEDAAGVTAAGCVAATAGAFDAAAVSGADPSPERSHQIVPTRMTRPAAANNPTRTRPRRLEGTGTESLGNGDDRNTRDVGDVAGSVDDEGVGDTDGADATIG